MNQENNYQLTQNDLYNDEINLKNLVSTLWVNKLWIIASTIVFGGLAIIYALFAQQWWSSTAQIIPPRLNDYANYYYQVNKLRPMLPQFQLGQLNNMLSSDMIFQKFLDNFHSESNKKAFLLTQPVIQNALIQKTKNKPSQKELITKQFLASWYNKISVTEIKPILLNSKRPIVVHFQAMDANSSLLLLQNYTDFVNKIVNKDLYNDLSVLVSIVKNSILDRKNLLMDNAEHTLINKIKLNQYSIDIAKASGINKPLTNFRQNADELFPINLGSEALEQRMETLKQLLTTKNYQIINQPIDVLIFQLKEIEAHPVDYNSHFLSYSYVSTPIDNMTRDSPKRLLVVILGMFFGVFFGVFLGLTINVLKIYKKK